MSKQQASILIFGMYFLAFGCLVGCQPQPDHSSIVIQSLDLLQDRIEALEKKNKITPPATHVIYFGKSK